MKPLSHSEAIDCVLQQKEFNFVEYITWDKHTLRIKTIYNEKVYTLEEFTRCFIVSLGVNVIFNLELLEEKLLEIDHEIKN